MSTSALGLLVAVFACCVFSVQARADTELGIQAIVLSGTHFETKEDVSGTGFAGFIQFDQRWKAVQIHVEGIPSVGTALVNTPTGQVRATLGMFSASARFRVDRAGTLWVGAGTQVLAQRTPQAGISTIDASRLAGTRYELFGEFPTGVRKSHFFETDFAVMPHLSGILDQTRTAPRFERFSASAPETAGMTDLSFAYGITRGRCDYLGGVRAFNFAAKFPDGREADRNVGSGVFATVRVRV